MINPSKKMEPYVIPMRRPEMRRVKHIHFIGIGGIGMCGIAEVLLNENYMVSGSDLASSAVTDRLKRFGAKVYQGHQASNIEGADVVVYSSAVKESNPEMIAARENHIPVIQRAVMLAELMRFRTGIAIAGTHGKTTTTSLATSVMQEAGLDPTFVIGGRLSSAETTAKLGSGQYLIVEADESDTSFLHLTPTIEIVTNIDEDHMDTFGHDINKLHQTFLDFFHRLPFYGLAIVCMDDPGVQAVLPKIARPTITYGFKEGADIRAIDVVQKGTSMYFTVLRPAPFPPLKVHLNLAGEHNVLNALSVIALAMDLGISDKNILSSLEKFSGVDRRFQQLGHYHFKGGSALIIDDYGHNAKKVEVTIKAARKSWPNQRLVMMFQPHRYTRTRDLFNEFAQVLSDVDLLLLFEVYAAGDDPIPGINSTELAKAIAKIGKVQPILVKDKNELPAILENVLKNGDIVLSQGAGSISAIARDLLEKQKNAHS